MEYDTPPYSIYDLFIFLTSRFRTFWVFAVRVPTVTQIWFEKFKKKVIIKIISVMMMTTLVITLTERIDWKQRDWYFSIILKHQQICFKLALFKTAKILGKISGAMQCCVLWTCAFQLMRRRFSLLIDVLASNEMKMLNIRLDFFNSVKLEKAKTFIVLLI